MPCVEPGADMRRREFITLVGGAAATWPLAVRAQQPALPVIGFFHLTSLELTSELLAAFHRGLGDTAYIEGRNVAIEYRWAHGQNDRLPTLVAELVRRQVSVIVILESTHGALSAKAATQTIPIVFMQAVGGLMSYGTNYFSAWRQAGVYTGRILKGEKPADFRFKRMNGIKL